MLSVPKRLSLHLAGDAAETSVDESGDESPLAAAAAIAAPAKPSTAAAVPSSSRPDRGSSSSSSSSETPSSHGADSGGDRGRSSGGGGGTVAEALEDIRRGDPDATFAQPGPGDFAFDGAIEPLPRGYRPGKTHVRGAAGKRGAATAKSHGGKPPADRPAGDMIAADTDSDGGGGGKAAKMSAAAKSMDVGQPGFAPSDSAIVQMPPARLPGGAENPVAVRSPPAAAAGSAGAAAAAEPTQPPADGSAARGERQQQWADRFEVSAGAEARDVRMDPVAAVRKWQAALFGSDNED